MRLYLVRHGQTAWNASGKAQGHQDIPLNEVGLAQAQALTDAFKPGDLDRIIASDLGRAAETANFVARHVGVELETDARLRERSFGQWEGESFHEVGLRMGLSRSAEDPTSFRVRPPGGESFEDIWARTGKLAEELKSGDLDSLVVSHGGTLSILLTQLLTHSKAIAIGPTHRSFRFENCAITELRRRDDGTLLLQRYNDTEHLRTRATVG